jgi:DNA-binding SARP family transcriptional activator
MSIAAPPSPLSFRVLGPLQVVRGSGVVDVGFPQHRAVLASLLVDVDRVVPADVLSERVWADRAATASSSLQPCISRLRRVLEPDAAAGAWSVIRTQAPGYRLATPPVAVDAVRFVQQVRRARLQAEQGALLPAADGLAAAMSMWRGRPYGDVLTDFAAVEARRLEEVRLCALELSARVDLRLGRHDHLLEQLPALLHDEPLNEALRACLVLALYRSGRQGDALQQLTLARDLLAEELGVDPGPELRRLQEQVLRQDPALDAPPARRASAAHEGAARRPGACTATSRRGPARLARAGRPTLCSAAARFR